MRSCRRRGTSRRNRCRSSGDVVGQRSVGAAAVGVADENVDALAVVDVESDLGSVRRPRWVVVALARGGDLEGRAAVGVHRPDVIVGAEPRLLLKAIFVPSGDHSGCVSCAGSGATATWPLPSAFITKMSKLPLRPLANAILVPSGRPGGVLVGGAVGSQEDLAAAVGVHHPDVVGDPIEVGDLAAAQATTPAEAGRRFQRSASARCRRRGSCGSCPRHRRRSCRWRRETSPGPRREVRGRPRSRPRRWR